MDRDTQEDIFIREVEKRIDQLASELELDAYFVLGVLARISHKVQTDMDIDDNEFKEEEDK